MNATDEKLTLDEQHALLRIARQSIVSRICAKPINEEYFHSPVFDEKRGAFVTLHNHGELRGCLGFIYPVKQLKETIQEMAVAAALHDPRFTPIKPDEVDAIDIEISVLTPMREITDVTEITPGKHGLYIEKGYNKGLLLPQVASENDWDRTTFLEHTCLKAGLNNNAWQDKNTRILIFSALVFGEINRDKV